VHQVNIGAIAARLSAKPVIRVELGVLVGRFGEKAYALGSTAGGLAQAIRRMSQLRQEVELQRSEGADLRLWVGKERPTPRGWGPDTPCILQPRTSRAVQELPGARLPAHDRQLR